MFSKTSLWIRQQGKDGRFKVAVVFALLALVVLFGAVGAQGPMRPPGPPTDMNSMGGYQGMGGYHGMGGYQDMGGYHGMGGYQDMGGYHGMGGWWGAPTWGWWPSEPGPEIEIIAVVADQTVSFKTLNLPEDEDFEVLMGPIYSRGVNGFSAGSFNSSDGVEERIYKIPPDLYGEYRIAIRIQTDHDYPYFAFNWFYNNDSEVNGTVSAVEEETAVESTAAETTEAETTEAETAAAETTTDEAGTGGAEAEDTETAAAAESASTETTQTVMVENNDVNGEVVPSFVVCAVRKDLEVHIQTSDFPLNEVFQVKMGVMPEYPEAEPYYNGRMMKPLGYDQKGMSMGKPVPQNSQAQNSMPMNQNGQGQYPMPMNQNGPAHYPMPMPPEMHQPAKPPLNWIPYYDAGTLETGDQGDIFTSFAIPAELAGAYRISIMLRTDDVYPYYAYNWFYNNSAVVCGP